MKGYVKVTLEQMQEAIDGFIKRYNKGKELVDQGVVRYHERFYTEEGNWYTKWRFKNLSPKEFTRKDIEMWGYWSDVLYKVMSKGDIEIINFWNTHHLSALDGPKAMVSESCDGFVLVDSEMAKAIQTYRGFL